MKPQFTYHLTFTNYRGEVVTHRLPRHETLMFLRVLRQIGDPAAKVGVRLVSPLPTRGTGGWAWVGRSFGDAAESIGERAASHGRQAPSGFYVPEERE